MLTRQNTEKALAGLGFVMTDSSANFIFASLPGTPGRDIYEKLKESGVLVRHFDIPRIRDYNRITVGTDLQMQTLIDKLKQII